MRNLIRLGALLLVGVAGIGEAGPPWFTTTGKLTRIGTGLAGEGFYLTLDILTTNNNCKFKQSLLLTTGHPQYQDIVSTVLVAFSQARPIDVYHDGTCWGDNVKLFAVSVRTTP